MNLLDIKLKSLSLEEKRVALVIMDVMLKKLHENGYMVTDFSPSQIYYQDGVYSFNKVMPVSAIVANNKEDAILNNVIWMSILALWVYHSNSSDTLMDPHFVSDHFDSFSFCYPIEDKAYYQSILVDSYRCGKIVSPIVYLSDYVIQQHQNQNHKRSNSLAYVKATEVGKAFANQDEAAFGHTFFFITLVVSFIVILLGVIFYFFIYFY